MSLHQNVAANSFQTRHLTFGSVEDELKLTSGVGNKFVSHIYDLARERRLSFGTVLLEEFARDFDGAPKASAKPALAAIGTVQAWLEDHPLPDEGPEEGWGDWICALPTEDVFPGFSDDLREILLQLDDIIENSENLGRFLNQIQPLGADLAASKSDGVRFMTMGMSKGLTVEAAIVAGIEEGIIPRPEANRAEERRFLYVAMTRARRHLLCTWSRRRHGPTARSGAPNVGAYRTHCDFLRDGPVNSQDGDTYVNRRRR